MGGREKEGEGEKEGKERGGKKGRDWPPF